MINYKTKDSVATGKIMQLLYTEAAKANKQLSVLFSPTLVIADATTATKVGKGSLLRVKGASSQYIVFGDNSGAMPNADVNSQTAVETPNDYFMTVATGEFVKTSAAMRIEVVED